MGWAEVGKREKVGKFILKALIVNISASCHEVSVSNYSSLSLQRQSSHRKQVK